jgi:hypothetical protein
MLRGLGSSVICSQVLMKGKRQWRESGSETGLKMRRESVNVRDIRVVVGVDVVLLHGLTGKGKMC